MADPGRALDLLSGQTELWLDPILQPVTATGGEDPRKIAIHACKVPSAEAAALNETSFVSNFLSYIRFI